MKRFRRLFCLITAFLLLSGIDAPAWAGGGWGLGLFAATLGLYAVTGGPYGWYDPYYTAPYYPTYSYPPYSYPPPYAYANPININNDDGYAPPSQPLLNEHDRPSLPNMTPLPGEPLPPNAIARLDPAKVNEKLASVRALLDKKASAGDITSAQRDSEATYLTQIERVAQAQASAQKGLLSSDQEEALLRELARAETLIAQNFASL